MARQNNEKEPARRLRLSIFDDSTHDLLREVKFTKTRVVWILVSALVILSLVLWLIIAYTPIRTFIPGYPDARTKRLAVQNAMRVDSLQNTITYLQLYTENLAYLLDGKVQTSEVDSLFDLENISSSQVMTSSYIAERDSLLRLQVKENAASSSEEKVPSAIPVEGLHFFSPMKGVVAREFNLASHPYVDITAPSNAVVTAVLDGTVIFIDYSDLGGYTVMLQHASDIISVYRHNQTVLKKVGEKVKAGAPVSLLGAYGTPELGDHLRFELWYKGEPVDPSMLISF